MVFVFDRFFSTTIGSDLPIPAGPGTLSAHSKTLSWNSVLQLIRLADLL